MGQYIQRDAETTFSGDLVIARNGDISLASAYITQVSLANFWLRTDNADYVPAPDIGANLGQFIGENNSRRTLQDMEDQTQDTMIRDLFYPDDVAVKVIPFDQHEALVAVQIAGDYLESGKFVTAKPTVYTYLFPYIDGKAIPGDL